MAFSNAAALRHRSGASSKWIKAVGVAALTASLAGRLAYTQYGFVKRWIMWGIARREGGSTDTTRDHDYTDWREVARFADRVGAAVRAAMAGERVAV